MTRTTAASGFRAAKASALIGIVFCIVQLLLGSPVRTVADQQVICHVGNTRYAATLQYFRSAYAAFDEGMPTVVQFTDTPVDDPSQHLTLAHIRDTGSIMGLAYDHEGDVLYAGSYVKAFGPNSPYGTRQIFRLSARQVDVRPWVELPGDAVTPYPVPGSLVGKHGLGDLEVDPVGKTLLAVNLEDRRIYRLSLADGRIIGSFANGAASQPWSVNARPFGLGIQGGWLYHGVVDSRQDTRVSGSLSGYVFRSRTDGSEMSLVTSFSLIRTARSEPWRAWDDRSNPDRTMLGQPMLTDIEFDDSGNLIIGLRDRASDMRLDSYLQRSPQGDVLGTVKDGEKWQVITSGSGIYDDSTPYYSDAVQGMLAAAPDRKSVVATALGVGHQSNPGSDALLSGVVWLDNSTKQQLSREALVGCFPCQRPIDALGDVESTCGDGAEVTPSATATAPPDRTATPTLTAVPPSTETVVPSASMTPTLPATPVLRPVFLPGLVRESCTPGLRKSDLILVIDASTTMLEKTRAGRTKIDAAIAAASTLASDLDVDRDRLGLVWFNESSQLELGPTFDRAAFRSALGRIQVRELTRIESGITAAHSALTGVSRRIDAQPVIMLITDGRANPGPESLALAAADSAKTDDITVFTVGIGEKIDAANLQSMATSPDHFVHAPDGEDLPAAYARVRDALPCPDFVFWP